MTEHSAALLAFPDRSEDRLRLALRRLVAALEAQSAAVAGWRRELDGLAGAVGGLQASMSRYRGALDGTAAGLARAGEEARGLERTAEAWVAATRR